MRKGAASFSVEPGRVCSRHDRGGAFGRAPAGAGARAFRRYATGVRGAAAIPGEFKKWPGRHCGPRRAGGGHWGRSGSKPSGLPEANAGREKRFGHGRPSIRWRSGSAKPPWPLLSGGGAIGPTRPPGAPATSDRPPTPRRSSGAMGGRTAALTSLHEEREDETVREAHYDPGLRGDSSHNSGAATTPTPKDSRPTSIGISYGRRRLRVRADATADFRNRADGLDRRALAGKV